MATDRMGRAVVAPTLGAVVVIGRSGASEGLAGSLQNTGRLDYVWHAADYASSVTMVAASPPHVALVSARLPDRDGLAAAAMLKRVWPAVGVILVDAGGPHHLRAAIEAGLDGFYLEDAPTADLVQGVRLVRVGGVAIDPRVRPHLFALP